MISLDWTILAAGIVFLFTLWALNKLLFKPLLNVLDQRRSLTVETREEASQKTEYREALLREYLEKVKQEKQKGYQLVEAVRKETMEERRKRIFEARSEAESLMNKARAEVNEEVESVKQELKRDAEEMAEIIADRVLGK
jgi:F-type H+-transporting ATPase subunit b